MWCSHYKLRKSLPLLFVCYGARKIKNGSNFEFAVVRKEYAASFTFRFSPRSDEVQFLNFRKDHKLDRALGVLKFGLVL